MRFFASLVLAIALPALGLAHSKMDATVPANDAVMDTVPKQLEFTFGKKIRLTKVSVTDADGDPVDVDLSDHKAFRGNFVLPVELEGTGIFQVAWKGLSADGHIMSGTFSFLVK